MFSFLKDFITYPFDENKETNKFWKFLQLLFKDYPAFLRTRPSWRRAVAFPFIALAKIFEKKKSL